MSHGQPVELSISLRVWRDDAGRLDCLMMTSGPDGARSVRFDAFDAPDLLGDEVAAQLLSLLDRDGASGPA